MSDVATIPIVTPAILGKPLGVACDVCAQREMVVRVVERDGLRNFVTTDHRTDRVNVKVLGGVVVGVDGIY